LVTFSVFKVQALFSAIFASLKSSMISSNGFPYDTLLAFFVIVAIEFTGKWAILRFGPGIKHHIPASLSKWLSPVSNFWNRSNQGNEVQAKALQDSLVILVALIVSFLFLDIVFGRALHLQRTLGEAAAELTPLLRWDAEEDPPHTSAEIVHGLEQTWRIITSCLMRGSSTGAISEEEAQLAQTIWGLLDHDLPHAGELSLLLGAAGLPGVEI
jgi:hypothetical protein